MGRAHRQQFGPLPLGLWACPMLLLLLLPLVALMGSTSPSDLWTGMQNPIFMPALWLSAKTSFVSLLVIVLAGTPLAWWMATATPHQRKVVTLLVDLPIVIPPAVLGIALLQTSVTGTSTSLLSGARRMFSKHARRCRGSTAATASHPAKRTLASPRRHCGAPSRCSGAG